MSAVETPPPQTGRRCPQCGAGLTERQEWCLHCGSSVGARVVAAPGWRTPLVLAGLLIALTAVAVTLAIVTLADDTAEVAQAPPAGTNAAPTVTPAPTLDPATATPDPAATATPDPAATATPDPAATATPTSTPAPAPDTGSPTAGVETWQQGESGWTVVLASERSRSAARAKARRFAASGTSGVGILDSDEFSSLTGGYWVVYAGRHPNRAAAEEALQDVDAPDAYVRQVTPR
jgi:septal ring-binding cell division protein DamX